MLENWLKLYYLDTLSHSNIAKGNLFFELSSFKKEKIRLDHCQIRNLLYRVLEVYFLLYFKILELKIFIVTFVNLQNTSVYLF